MSRILTFDSQQLVVDWISFKIQGLTDPLTIASGLCKQFTPHVRIDYHGFKKESKVSIRQSTGFKSYWVGVIKTQKFDWKILMVYERALSLAGCATL